MLPVQSFLTLTPGAGWQAVVGVSSHTSRWRGEALSCVVIDKLPFSSPDDSVLAACIGAMKRAGGNPFFECRLPKP